jgi:UrcA family protein
MLKELPYVIAGAALFAAPAFAEPAKETRGVSVSYEDLDLGSDEGRAELDRRIENAAKQACGVNEHEVGSRIVSRDARRCVREAKRNIDDNFADLINEQQRGG